MWNTNTNANYSDDKSYTSKNKLVEESSGGDFQDANIVAVDEETTGNNDKPHRASRWSNIDTSEVHCCDTRNKKIVWGVVVFVVLLTGIILLAKSLRSLESTEYGLKYNVHSKQLADAAKSGGLHAGSPGFEFIKFPSTYITADLPEDTCVSKDGLRISFQVTFQYQLPSEWVLPVVRKYSNFDKWATVVEVAGKSAVQHSCSDFQVVEFQNQRGLIQTTMENNLSLKLEGPNQDGASGIYARVISLQLRNVDVPSEYRTAVQEKQTAKEDIELAKSQRTQERTKANTKLLAAKEEARKIMDTARNEAELLLTEARLKAEETLFQFEREAETLIMVKDSLNLTTDGLLAYISNQLLADSPQLSVTTSEPARLSRKDEL